METTTKHIIRFANLGDIDKIMKFIRDNWSSTHILGNDKEFFLYEFVKDCKNVNVVIGEDSSSGEIHGMMGVIYCSKDSNPDIFPPMWKVLEDKEPFLGIKIFTYLIKATNSRITAGIGMNDRVSSIYRAMRFPLKKMEQYYRIADKLHYDIAVINNKEILPISKCDKELFMVSDYNKFEKIFDKKALSGMRPYKDMWYIKNRYFDHPVYKYVVFSIAANAEDVTRSILIGREINVNQTKIFRFVDFIGRDEDLSCISYSVQQLIDRNGYEYVDMYCYGISQSVMKKAGFILRREADSNIIPNYFEPFVRKNIDLTFFATDIIDLRLFKADGDQDRPSIITD